MEDVKEINTTKGVLQYYRDWEHEGAVVMLNAQTIDRYKELKDEHPDTENYAVFFAFGNNQFSKGYQKLVHRGCIKNGDKLYHAGAGLYGTKEGLDKFFDSRKNATHRKYTSMSITITNVCSLVMKMQSRKLREYSVKM